MAFFAGIFGAHIDSTTEGGFEVTDDPGHMKFDILGLTAEDDSPVS